MEEWGCDEVEEWGCEEVEGCWCEEVRGLVGAPGAFLRSTGTEVVLGLHK